MKTNATKAKKNKAMKNKYRNPSNIPSNIPSKKLYNNLSIRFFN
jgi:hypothetical protein